MIFTFASSQVGAAVLSGTAGALSTLLRACLVDGFGAGAVATLVVADGIATATYSGTHPFAVGCVGRFAGAAPAGLNGDKVILSVAAKSVTFAAPGVPDGPATGTITSKAAPAGWSERFAGALANTLVLQSAAIESTGCVLRIDDAGTTAARVLGYETMSDVSTGVGPFPTDAQTAGGMYWPKSDSAGAGGRAWRVFADAQSFVVWLAPVWDRQAHGVVFGFGDLLADKSVDPYACALSGGASNVATNSAVVGGCLGYGHAATVPAVGELYVPRAYTGIGAAQAGKKVAAHNLGGGYSGTAAYNPNAFPFPNPADNSLRLAPVELLVGPGFRGRVAGIYHTPQIVGESFQTGDLVPGSGEFAGKTFMALRAGAPAAALSTAGVVFVCVSDSWR